MHATSGKKEKEKEKESKINLLDQNYNIAIHIRSKLLNTNTYA